MSLNSEEINLIISELDITGSMIQNIIQPDFKTLVLTTYKPSGRAQLLISLAQGKSRLNLTTRHFPKQKKQQRFEQFLKANISGARITSISQINKERIIRIDISGSEKNSIMWLRLWGGNGNIIITDSNYIIEELFFRKPSRNESAGNIFNFETDKPQISSDSNKPKTYTVRDFPANNSDPYPFNNFIDNFYKKQEESEEIALLREKAKARVIKKLSIAKTSWLNVKNRLKSGENYEQLKDFGQIILSSKHLIKPGDQTLETENFFGSGEKIVINLDSTISPDQNAENYFKKYKKLKSSESNLKEEEKNLNYRVSVLENLLESLESENEISKLKLIISETETKQEEKLKGAAPGLQFYSGSYRLIVGRTATENDELLRKYTNGNDYWLHARDYPGSYVFIKSLKGKSVPLETLIDAGNLAIFFSKGKNSGKGEVYYTQVKYLRRAKNSKKGTVLPTQEKNLSISLNNDILKKFFDKESKLLMN